MAGFGAVGLTQTAVGALLDQRAIVLYEQPEIDKQDDNGIGTSISRELWGNQFKYKELFSGLLSSAGVIGQAANVAGANPYGITYIDAKVNIESELCDHPVEKGMVITDASIILPVSAEVTVAMPTHFAENIYNSMKDLYTLKKPKIILQTKYGLYKNLVLQNIEYELEPNSIDRAKFILTLREVQEIDAVGNMKEDVSNADNVANGSDASTVDTGGQVAA